jgi:regulator of protease activity HflC (stomatin/prohibitin superfamily)
MRTLVWCFTFVVFGLILVALTFVIISFVDSVFGESETGLVCLGPWGFIAFILALAVPGMISRTLYIIPEYQRVVALKLGEFVGIRGPGQAWVIPYPPFYQSAAMILDMRIQTHIIKAAETLTKDNVPVGCEAVIFWRVENPRVAALKVQNHAEAVYLAANSALKDTIGTLELTQLLSHRELVAQNLKEIIDKAAEQFGVDVSSVEITDVHVPPDLIQELSVRAQSERAAQAKIAEAKAELEVAQNLERAAQALGPQAMELYRLSVLERIGREEGSQVVIYGMGADADRGQQIASSVAGVKAGMRQQRSAPPVAPAPPPER